MVGPAEFAGPALFTARFRPSAGVSAAFSAACAGDDAPGTNVQNTSLPGST